MKRTLIGLTALGLLAGGSTALAVKVGESLYVKAKNTAVKASPAATADTLLVLQPGARVTWNGAHKSAKQWHRVEVNGKSGVVFQSNLATKPPATELVAGKKGSVDAQAFASSGAAVKALGPGAEAYGEQSNSGQAVKDIKALEELAKSVTDAELAAHAKKAGLFPVVGASATGGEK